jgi:hypothetical protein
MRRFIFILLAVLCGLPLFLVKAQEDEASPVAINAPKPGEALQGQFPIRGSSSVDGFVSMELIFSYSDDSTNTWFLIYESDQPVSDGVFVQWDTTRIIDGIYDLRLVVSRRQGEPITVTIPGVRVRNYTPIETDTPIPSISGTPDPDSSIAGVGDLTSIELTISPTTTPILQSSTPLPTNPAEISPDDINESILRGAAGVFAFFILLGLYLSIRRIFLS